jgi:diadenosine tetraphosphate (Ap4A) HIT family hydrolase
MKAVTARRELDWDEYLADIRSACFICELVSGRRPHHVVLEDEFAIAFLNRFPTLRGQTIVAPKEHREQVTGDFTEDEYVRLQAVVRRVGEAVRHAFPTERLYVLSLGSQQGNRHVHWHVAPLPPGVPFEEQQAEALRAQNGVLDLGDGDFEDDAKRVRQALRQEKPARTEHEEGLQHGM